MKRFQAIIDVDEKQVTNIDEHVLAQALRSVFAPRGVDGRPVARKLTDAVPPFTIVNVASMRACDQTHPSHPELQCVLQFGHHGRHLTHDADDADVDATAVKCLRWGKR